jgi:3D-(3,5/4)-trihydroxycyclohexane-1,2-dione acylhydrolase (decyclizing)
MIADAQAGVEILSKILRGWIVSPAYRKRVEKFNRDWDAEVTRIYSPSKDRPPISQGAVIGAVNEFSRPQDVVLCAAGSLPGDLHKLWRTRNPKGYHMEYGYSCMGYEIAGGLGVKMAAPDREVYVMVGDGSWLMMSSELVTSIQEGHKLTVVLLDNHGFQSIGGLSQAIGSGGFGTKYRFRNAKSGQLDGDNVPVDYAANARSLGAHVIKVRDLSELKRALEEARKQIRTTVIVVETDPNKRVPGYESWWDVPIAEVSEIASVRRASDAYQRARRKERYFL